MNSRALFLRLACAWLLLLPGLFFSGPAWSFVATGFSWDDSAAEVHLNFDITNPAAFRPINAVAGLVNADFQQAYIDAMEEWNTTTNFQWFANESGAEPQPCKGVLNGAAFSSMLCNEVEFGSSTLAVQSTFQSGTSATRTFTIFNNNKLWNIYSGTGTGNDFRRVAVHELGHGLGLSHAGSNAIMYEFVTSTEVPQADDIAGANSVYPSSGGNDIDGDGVDNTLDNCPLVSNASQTDSDLDGTGNACDLDTDLLDLDEDGIANLVDNCPLDINDMQHDSDSDGEGDLCDLDRDGDGVANLDDNCPDESNAGQEDLDTDGLGNACDDDSDGDGVLSYETVDIAHEYSAGSLSGGVMPAGPTGTQNTAFELYGQTFEVSRTGLLTAYDLPFFCPDGDVVVQLRNVLGNGRPGSSVFATQPFSAQSGILPKSSVSGFTRFEFDSPFLVNAGTSYAFYISVTGSCFMFTSSSDYSDGAAWLGSPSWASVGNDYRFRVWIEPVTLDNCPLVANASQLDSNMNGVGDACDPLTLDDDSDTIVNALDNCPQVSNFDQLNTDGDSEGDACDADDDNDTINDGSDNCPLISNLDQLNTDGDSEGDACDADDDNDGLSDNQEIAIYGTNPLIADTDEDGVNDGDEVLAGTDPLAPPALNIPFPATIIWLLLVSFAVVSGRRYSFKYQQDS